MREEELLRCQIQEWYPIFKPYSIRTLFHPLPDSFLRYLLGLPLNPSSPDGDADGDDDAPPPFLLPVSASGRDPLPRATAHIDPVSLLDFDTSFSSSDDEDAGEASSTTAPSFPELEAAVERSIAALGGAAFPKLNWSAPKDAAWISADGTLRCTSFVDVALLLRSSDAIAHDLSHALPSCRDNERSSTTTFYLALRKWYPSLRPEMEFRCFARHRRLVGISQREVTGFYPVLLDRHHEIQPLIEVFFAEVVKPRFGSEDYTFDVYVTGDGRVKLLDFNPWGAFTLPLLFSWEELEGEGFGGEEGRAVEFRIVESQCGLRPGLKTAVPFDYLDTAESSGWDQFLKKADEELRRQIQTTPAPDAD
ncbi:uncharacterized protein [Elaeis guineensis]|uniref:Cell division cycle protein 123 homolog n=1 Tax=Elaeis guineensis var. tenera TaxID=51953 RepID=A0A6I9S2T3_ELAGV|nr:cell division cycle protein 123 homolog [Elaeis guineensis]XP_010936806.1 cell division cycle protein 123 homolog [Elaeis guineensis]XP_029123753.1 cell division cycle protein 123 homolog [Elaeis guineensis]XP_029123754.1 cell division cycle protein 123 homolog [Elaeis guineensis]